MNKLKRAAKVLKSAESANVKRIVFLKSLVELCGNPAGLVIGG